MQLSKSKTQFVSAFSILLCVTANTAFLFCIVVIQFPERINAIEDTTPVNDSYKNASLVSTYPDVFDRNKAYEAAKTMDFEIELSLSAVNLKSAFTKFNPFCVTSICQYNDAGSCIKYHNTETLEDEVDPKFATKVMMAYSPYQEQKKLLFQLFSDNSHWIKRNDLGQNECTVGQLLKNGRTELPLWRKKEGNLENTDGLLIVHAEELTNNYDEIIFELAGIDLMNTDVFGKSDPYVEIYKHAPSKRDEYVLVYRSKVIKNSLNPTWDPIILPVRSLCNGDYDRKLKFLIWDWNRAGSVRHKFIGQFSTTLNDVANHERENRRIMPINKRKKLIFALQSENNVEHSGQVQFLHFEKIRIPSFADFIKRGLKLHGTIAIDYSIANGPKESGMTMHYRDANGALNQYEKAIMSAVNALEVFGDKKFSVLGFGAKHRSGDEDLIFNISPDGSAELVGIDAILNAYRDCVQNTQFYWPKNIEKVIQRFAKTVEASKSTNDHFILFILTQGGVEDVERTEEIIRRASVLPISIVFVGIGGNAGKFDSLRILDADHVRSAHHRDIVQFVQFNNYNPVYDLDETRAYLQSELLLEVPNHVVTYMISRDYIKQDPAPQ